MPVYTFRCRNCGLAGDVLRDTHDSTPPNCPDCANEPSVIQVVPMQRVFTSFGFKRSMAEHFNNATGTYVSNTTQLRDDFKRMSEERTQRLGIEHNFVPVDPADARDVYGITEAGLEETRRRHRELGWTERKQLWL